MPRTGSSGVVGADGTLNELRRRTRCLIATEREARPGLVEVGYSRHAIP